MVCSLALQVWNLDKFVIFFQILLEAFARTLLVSIVLPDYEILVRMQYLFIVDGS